MQVPIRMTLALKRQVKEYADEAGISFNAATCALLADALRAARRRAGQRSLESAGGKA